MPLHRLFAKALRRPVQAAPAPQDPAAAIRAFVAALERLDPCAPSPRAPRRAARQPARAATSREGA